MGSFSNVWDDTVPLDSQLASQGAQDFRVFRLDVQQRMAVISGVSTALPTFQLDAQPANWVGVLCFCTDNGHVYRFTNPGWTDVTSQIFQGVSQKVIKFVAGSAASIFIPQTQFQVGTVIMIGCVWAWTVSAHPAANLGIVSNNTPSQQTIISQFNGSGSVQGGNHMATVTITATGSSGGFTSIGKSSNLVADQDLGLNVTQTGFDLSTGLLIQMIGSPAQNLSGASAIVFF